MLKNETKTLWELLDWVVAEAPDKKMQTDRFTYMLALNRHLFYGIPIIKVAGTNGKGSVCAMLEQSLIAAGKKVGLFTSPHLVEIAERFRVNGRQVSHTLLESYAKVLKPILFQLVEEQGPQSIPSFFEILILIALQFFYDERVDIAIFEAGVGGYNDATSLLPSMCSVITTIGLDHQRQLGASLQDIAADKAGIANTDTRLIIGPGISDELKDIIKKDAVSRDVCARQADVGKIKAESVGLNGYKIELVVAGASLEFDLPLLGNFQLDNLATVVSVIDLLIEQGLIDNFNCLQGIEHVSWRGRLEYLGGTLGWLLDVAHNQPAFEMLAATVPNLVAVDDVVLLYGAAQGKDYESCIVYLPSIASEVCLLDGFYRSESVDTLANLLPEALTVVGKFSSARDAVDMLTSNPAYKDKVILVAGSVFIVGQVRDYLVTRKLVLVKRYAG